MVEFEFQDVTDFAAKYYDTRLEEWWVVKVTMPEGDAGLEHLATLYVVLTHLIREMGAKFQQIYVGPGDSHEWKIQLIEATEWNG